MQQQAGHSDEQRGFANARNAKLHHLAKQKRGSKAGPAARLSGKASAAVVSAAKPVLLSSVLAQTPQMFDSFKVACVERYLTHIDELPEQYHSAEVIYLSRNSLRSLAGIQQFPFLRVLSASDNLLEDIEQLQVLEACPNLQVASFERNPLACLPNYRNKLMQLLPRLQMLDGQGISGQDRQRAGAALKQEAACMAVMLSNACMVHKLARTAELLQLHTELRRTLFGSSSVLARSILPSAIPLDLLKFLKLWDYEGGLSPADRRIIDDALTREVVRVHRQLQHAAIQLKGPAQLPALQAWDAAFSQVMLAQQRTIIQLVELVNVLHDEAARLVVALTRGRAPGSPSKLELEQQEDAEQQMANER
ncbi:hypothetical protein OEZ85_004487 [Tetradesmus obliquus]|uniref:Uncharacterized protein n=1 Tax=Tetradesmus obliquus TaxID=3088 RepID=A0ABY8UL08_TETOB|nr:hypothetical protein OEZ85_004487 [Tetradesmus obliquus]